MTGDARFCRACGADVSLVPMALTGKLPTGGAVAKREGADPSVLLSKAISLFVTGLGFLVVAPLVFVFAPAGYIWWFWMFIPAFAMIGNAIAEYVRYRAAKAQLAVPPPLQSYEPTVGNELPGQGFTNSLPPASVTEHTTRQLRDSRERQEEPR